MLFDVLIYRNNVTIYTANCLEKHILSGLSEGEKVRISFIYHSNPVRIRVADTVHIDLV